MPSSKAKHFKPGNIVNSAFLTLASNSFSQATNVLSIAVWLLLL